MPASILILSPAFPGEMPMFVRGAAQAGARVLGIGEHPAAALPEPARASLADYIQVPQLFNEGAVIDTVRSYAKRVRIDRVECLWEPGMILAAKIREALSLPGLTVEQTVPFRDKEAMKNVLDRAGIRTPYHFRARTEDEIRRAAEKVGYPLIVKPIAGAGSADTHRVDNAQALDAILPQIRHVPEVSVEEFIDGEEYTFDTICSGGRVLYYNISLYRPRPLVARTNEWISPQTMVLRDPDHPYLADGKEMGFRVLQALGFRTGFTHMEWFRKPDGEAVFGEIGARPPGARTVDIMNYANDTDVCRGWAEALTHRRLSQPIQRKYNATNITKRAQGQGHIRHIQGMDDYLRRFGKWVCHVDLLPVGAHRRNWKQTLLSDGFIIVRHPDFSTCCEIADAFGTDVQMYAG